MSLQSDIQGLAAKFAADLESLVRSVAVSAVQSALGGSATAARALPPGAQAWAEAESSGPDERGDPDCSRVAQGQARPAHAPQIEATAN